MKLNIMKTAMCRTPAFSFDTLIEHVWEELKVKISESSPNFYQSIKDYGIEDLDRLNDKMWFTIWKYFKRAKYRATPFGSFSAVSLVSISRDFQQIKLSSQMVVHCLKDWNEVDAVKNKHSLKNTTQVYANSSIYYVMNEVRYLRYRNEKFEIASTIALPEIKVVLDMCISNTKVSSVISTMYERFGMRANEVKYLLRQMLSLQLVSTEKFPNIIGPDYFERIKSKSRRTVGNYLIAERAVLGGNLPSAPLEDIKDLILYFAKNLPDSENDALDTFKRIFREKFEDREVPLSHVMDPEIGIGYGKLEQPTVNENLELTLKNDTVGAIKITYSNFHTYILNSMISNTPIQLEEFCGQVGVSKEKLPNTLSVIMHYWKGRPVIEHMGGSTATSLIGRFTMMDQKFEEFARSIADIEEKANPDVLFFDIGYQAEKDVDNVNRRKKIYQQELPILTLSCLSDPLNFSDVLVSVRQNQVILRSKKHQKRLVPRVPSAYNYMRSDLAAYRFLCDVQNQNLKVNLRFSPRDAFPNLDRYPRINFRNIIVSPAMWLVPKKFTESRNVTDEFLIRDFSVWMEKEKIDFMFKAGDTDSILNFDARSAKDIKAFLMYCKQQNTDVYISEALISAESDVVNEIGGKYSAQFILNYYHQENIYQSIDNDRLSFKTHTEKRRIFLPGTDWLYYELYCYPTKSNSILNNQLKRFLTEARPYLKKWFFIRYDDPSAHIRLRLNLKNASEVFLVNSIFLSIIEAEVNAGQLSNVCIKSYVREIERYGANRIESIEELFHLDSKYILSLIRKNMSIAQLYINSIHLIRSIFLPNLNTLDEQIEFVKTMADSFAEEMQMTSAQFRKLNQSFNQIRGDFERMDVLPKKDVLSRYNKALGKVLRGAGKEEISSLLSDLIHMHVNRIFISDQRLHETVLYHYLLRYLEAIRARSRSQQVNIFAL